MDGSKYVVDLDARARERLEELVHNGSAPAKKIAHARVLLLSDEHHPAGRYHDRQIARILGLHVNTVAKVRKAFVLRGERPALERKRREAGPVPPKLDGRGEAQLVAICCSEPPGGRVRWTLSLLREELVGRKVVTGISRETVRKTLKKTRSGRGGYNASASPSGTARVSSAQMERVLDLYARPPDQDEPLICMDEAAKELHGQMRRPLPMSPGKPAREDDKYERHGSCPIFMFFAPHLGWRRADARGHRTRVDWAREIRQLLEEDYPDARKVHLVCDNLNTHDIASLYEAFPAEQARIAWRGAWRSRTRPATGAG